MKARQVRGFSHPMDGTTVDSRGRVSGTSHCANHLRHEANRALDWYNVNSYSGAIPSEKPLAFGEPQLVDCRIRWEAAEFYGLTASESPEIEAPEVVSEEPPEFEPDTVFVHWLRVGASPTKSKPVPTRSRMATWHGSRRWGSRAKTRADSNGEG